MHWLRNKLRDWLGIKDSNCNYEILDLTIDSKDGEKILTLSKDIRTVVYTNTLPGVEIRHKNLNNKVIFSAFDMEYADMRAKDCVDTPIDLKVVVFYA